MTRAYRVRWGGGGGWAVDKKTIPASMQHLDEAGLYGF